MESQNERTMTEKRTGISELGLSQLAEVTGGINSVGAEICQFIKDGHLVGPPNPPGKHPPIL
jgi:hypothetical protein